jgi:hypothetical protein
MITPLTVPIPVEIKGKGQGLIHAYIVSHVGNVLIQALVLAKTGEFFIESFENLTGTGPYVTGNPA